MKRFFALVMLVLLACAPIVAFAAEQSPASDQTGQAEGSEEEEGKTEAIDNFAVGMDKKAAKEAGAQPTKDPDTMVLSLSWKDAAWKTILMFRDDTMVSMVMQTAIDNKVLIGILGAMKDRNYKVLSATGADGKNIEFFKLKAQGKDKVALAAAFNEAFKAFADAAEGKFIAVFCSAETLDVFTEVAKKNGDEGAAMKKEGDSVLYILQMDKAGDKMALMMDTFANINAQ